MKRTGEIQQQKHITMIAVWMFMLVASIHTLQIFFELFTGEHTIVNFLFLAISEFVYWMYFPVLFMGIQWISRRKVYPQKLRVRWMGIHAILLTLSFFIHQLISFFTDRIMVLNTQKQLVEALFDNPAVWTEIFIYGLFLLLLLLIDYKKVMQEQAVTRAQVESELVTAKLHAARSRIHPKFLFTTLRMIDSLIHNHEAKKANHILSLMSEFLRVTVYDQDREMISLEEELRILQKYLDIEKQRLGSRFYVRTEIEPALYQLFMPSFLLQPLIEELVTRHLEYEQESYEIFIRGKQLSHSMEIRIGDVCGVSSRSDIPVSSNAVVAIIQERLQQMYGKGQYVFQEYQGAQGTSFILTLPFHARENQYSTESMMEES